MKATSVPSRHNGNSRSATVKCVIIYEDFTTGAHAKHLAEKLADAMGCTLDCESLWRSELMEFSEIGEDVAREAADSDFVILGLRGDRNLSFGFRRWIESWLTLAMDGGSALIALFDPNLSNASTASAARSYLHEMSASAGVAFFAHCPSRNEVLTSVTLPPAPHRRIQSPNLWPILTSTEIE